MLLVRKLHLHLAPFLVSAVLVMAGGIWQSVYSSMHDRPVSGSSLPGLVIGSVAAAIILFELLLWPRKRLRRFKLFRTKTWMAFHLWLGLACGPLAWIHAGYRTGGSFTTILMGLLVFVLVSGIYGWIMQIVIPKWMLGNLPHETIYSQIDDVSLQNALEARQLLTVALGPKPPQSSKLTPIDDVTASMRGSGSRFDESGHLDRIVVGATQKRLPSRSAWALEAQGQFSELDRVEIWKAYASTIEPFFLHRVPNVPYAFDAKIVKARSPLGNLQQSIDWFGRLRQACSTNSSVLLDRLQSLVEQHQQFAVQRSAHAWMHRWIAFHASVSVLLGVLLVAHIVLAMKYA